MSQTLNQSIVLMARRTANVARLSQKFFQKFKQKYHTMGFNKTWADVYVKFPEGDYERTGDLLNSFSTELITDGMKLFLNETSTIAAVKPGEYQYYPSYVSRGIFSRQVKHPGARNIPSGWKNFLGPIVLDDFRKAVDKEVVRVS